MARATRSKTKEAAGAPPAKKAKVEEDGKLETGDDGKVQLKQEESKPAVEEKDKTEDSADQQQEEENQKEDKNEDAGPKTTAKQGEEPPEAIAKESSPGPGSTEPSHGTLESGHVYFLYRPKIDVEEVEGVDDVSKFHILLIPKSAPYDKGHYHRILQVARKQLPDPTASRGIIWGMVDSVGTDRGTLKDSFGAYEYDTKTKGRRQQPAARPAARGHYILHSPRDEVADDPKHNKQRDYRLMLAYEITTPAHEDFGNVQRELGLEEKGAVVLSVKNPEIETPARYNPRAASLPREKRARFPKHLEDLFHDRRWIPPNPPAMLDYPGAELLFQSRHKDFEEVLGENGEKVEEDLDKAAQKEATDKEGALKELGLSKKDTEVEALDGEWA